MSEELVITLNDILADEEALERYAKVIGEAMHDQLAIVLREPSGELTINAEAYYLFHTRFLASYMNAFAAVHDQLHDCMVDQGEISVEPLEHSFHELITMAFESIIEHRQNPDSAKSSPSIH